MRFQVRELELPIVQAPMAGGPSTVALAAAVGAAGGIGFLAAGYRTPAAVSAELAELRSLIPGPFGLNLFSPPAGELPESALAAYGAAIARDAERYGVRVGEPRFDDDYYRQKLQLAIRERVPVVSFTFGCPDPGTVERLHAAGSAVWVTVTDPLEAGLAERAGADALVAQGTEAGGHRGYFDDSGSEQELGLLVLLRLIAAKTGIPLIAAGGIMDGPGIAAVLCAGASAAQLGTALMLTPEAGTFPAQRAKLASSDRTRLTRAFSGRNARGIVNEFMAEHDAEAPPAYPQVHHLTAPIRAAARRADDPERVNLWAGQAHELAVSEPAEVLVRELWRQASEALARTSRRCPEPDSGP
ncbi:MAG: NAD(P)H-dependent flavin oxidoreductase [Solirubrobacteraceae bacterium]